MDALFSKFTAFGSHAVAEAFTGGRSLAPPLKLWRHADGEDHGDGARTPLKILLLQDNNQSEVEFISLPKVRRITHLQFERNFMIIYRVLK
jgi:hypothetical protein